MSRCNTIIEDRVSCRERKSSITAICKIGSVLVKYYSLMTNKFRTTSYNPIRKLKVILSGLYVAVVTDFSVAYKVILSIPVLGGSFFLRQWVDISLILLAMGLMLISELFNSAIEVLCDFVEPKHNQRIGIIKDISAAATGLSILVWATILTIESIRLLKLH
jgi:diacylglycerol kinase